MKQTARRRVIIALWVMLGACPCCLCGFGYLALRSTFFGPAADLPHQLDLARQAGMPTEPEDLRPHPPVPDAENAATIYSVEFPKIQALFKNHKDLRTEWRNVVKGLAKPGEISDLKAAITEANPMLARIKVASSRPHCDFHYKYEEGFDLLFPQSAQSKSIGTLLAAKAHFLGEEGKVDEAFDLLGEAESISHHVGETPCMIAMLVGLAIDGIVMEEFSHLLELSMKNATLLDKAKKTLDGFGPVASLRYAFRGEIVLGRKGLQKIRTFGDISAVSGDNDSGEAPKGSGLNIPDSIRKGFESKFVEAWRKAYTGLPKDPSDWLGAKNSLDQFEQEIDRDNSLSNILNKILFPVFSGASMAIGHQEANRNLAQTSIRIMQDAIKNGTFPSTLPKYGPTAIDPFDGKPLRYRRTPDGFLIYSIDRDLEDNGGRVKTDDKNGDLVRTYRTKNAKTPK